MPAVSRAVPSALYVVLGATHPDLLLHEGEAYRRRLEATAETLDVTDHVRFVDRFVGRTELGTWLEAADIFVTPYPNLDQIVSGTLSYAMGAGKAVVSTPTPTPASAWPAAAGGSCRPARRRRWPTRSSGCSGTARRARAIGRRAYDLQRRHDAGPRSGRQYAAIFARVAARRARPGVAAAPRAAPTSRSLAWLSRPLYPVSRAPPERAITGPLGIWQHAAGPVPDHAFGYCTDDVARALLVDLAHARELGWGAVEDERLALAAVPGCGIRPGGPALPQLPWRGQGLGSERARPRTARDARCWRWASRRRRTRSAARRPGA